MLLFSTVLTLKPFVTCDDLMHLVEEWNRTSPYEENIIHDFRWNKETSGTFGDEKVNITIMHDQRNNIRAIRYRKRDHNGIHWDTDYIMHCNDHTLAIRLQRSYSEDALTSAQDYSAPHFISLLVDKDWLEVDNALKIDKKPLYITSLNADIIGDVVTGKESYKLPIVFVSSTKYDSDPLDVLALAKKLKGVAHVLVQANLDYGYDIRTACDSMNEYDGAIGIYFPQDSYGHRRILYHGIDEYDVVQYSKVVRQVMQYANAKTIDPLYTWDGVYAEVLRYELAEQREKTKCLMLDKQSKASEETAEDFKTLYQMMMEEQEKLLRELQEKNQMIASLRQEIHDREVLVHKDEGYLKCNTEEDLYYGESREIILDILQKAFRDMPDNFGGIRRNDVLAKFLESNPSTGALEQRKEEVKRLLKNFKGLDSTTRKGLKSLGFEITEDGKHIKLKYYGYSKYEICFAKTPSDVRSGKNNATTIINKAF